MDVAAWLQGLGLERYVPAFRDNEIDWDALPKLSAEDLKDLGVVLGGHRRRLLDAIAALGAAAPAASATAAPRDAPALAEADPATRPTRRGRLRAPDDLCRSGDAKDLDETGHLVEQVSASVVRASFSQDDHGDKAGSDLLNPAGVFQDAICCGHQTTHPSK
jgi:SAM domain (Sterile alpha motif)